MKIFLFFLLALNLIASDEYSLKTAYGQASKSSLGDIVSGDFYSNKTEKDLSVISFDGGYLLKESLFDVPLDIYVKGGLSYFNENAASRDNVYEATLYIKAYYNLDFLDNRIRFGIGEGGSYTSGILFVEYEEALAKNDNNSNFLNYLDISVDFDLGRLIRVKGMHNTYVGWALKHRSGIFGLINNVEAGGSNYNTIYLEKNF
ncbi:hypothetical protein JHD49_00255 [Sulfurimonas sp. SAG-AH-194-C21]|nr:hypothetical protein [Sulfurimonas sp. SAG-AH-194-C21]MDF1882367.1 hypothetical protein [Sulfurimonas sp. SAG-AH-194-C21]